jgi:prevent-host-death family protein
MPDVIYNLYEAKSSLSQLVDRASSGEEIFIAKAGTPMAKLVPIPQSRKPRKPGGWEGRVVMTDDFDAPLPEDLQAAFEGRS